MRIPTRRGFIVAGAGALAAPAIFASSASRAQGTFPSKPIRIVVPYPAGRTDRRHRARLSATISRASSASRSWSRTRAAPAARSACAEVKRAAPDGYTILCTISSSLIQNRVTVKDLPYDPEKDFTYLTMTTSLGGPVVAAEKTGATNLKQFVEYARKVDKVNWGAYGPGSTPQMLIETMARQYGFKVEVVQYRGEAAMWADVTAQQLDGAAGSPAASAPVIATGKGRAIAMMGDRLRGLARCADDDGAGRGRRLLRDARLRGLRRSRRDAARTS